MLSSADRFVRNFDAMPFYEVLVDAGIAVVSKLSMVSTIRRTQPECYLYFTNLNINLVGLFMLLLHVDLFYVLLHVDLFYVLPHVDLSLFLQPKGNRFYKYRSHDDLYASYTQNLYTRLRTVSISLISA